MATKQDKIDKLKLKSWDINEAVIQNQKAIKALNQEFQRLEQEFATNRDQILKLEGNKDAG